MAKVSEDQVKKIIADLRKKSREVKDHLKETDEKSATIDKRYAQTLLQRDISLLKVAKKILERKSKK